MRKSDFVFRVAVLSGLIVLACGVFLWGSNPVHGVLTLVGTGLAFAGVLLVGGLEFPALLVVLVYVGAVTVLFVFVVMMVNLRGSPSSYVTVESSFLWAALAGSVFLAYGVDLVGLPLFRGFPPGEKTSNLVTLGGVLYGTERAYGVLLVGGVLFVAMVAAICLSLVSGENYRTQEFYTQIRRPNAVFNFSRAAGFFLPLGLDFPLISSFVILPTTPPNRARRALSPPPWWNSPRKSTGTSFFL